MVLFFSLRACSSMLATSRRLRHLPSFVTATGQGHELCRCRSPLHLYGFASLVSALFYEKWLGSYFCKPVIVGLGENDEPFIRTMDCIGAKWTFGEGWLLICIRPC